MLICDRCARSNGVLHTHINLKLVAPNVAVGLKDIDLCIDCRDAYEHIVSEFIQPLAQESKVSTSRAYNVVVHNLNERGFQINNGEAERIMRELTK